MKISIITPCFNSAGTLADTIQSVARQTWPNIEHIVIDGGSSDHTGQVVAKYRHLLAHYVSEPDRGLYDAINKGIALASGEVIAILNADDFYADAQVLERAMTHFLTGAQALYGDLDYVSADNTALVVRKWRSGNYRFRRFLLGWMPPHPTFFLRKSLYEEHGGYDIRLRSAADYELMLRFLFKLKIHAVYLPRVMVKMRLGGQSNASLSNRWKANQEDRMAWKMNDLKPLPFTLLLKPLRKIRQFRLLKYLYEGWIKPAQKTRPSVSRGNTQNESSTSALVKRKQRMLQQTRVEN